MKTKILLGVILSTLFSISASAATLVIDSGQLRGATGVDVGGSLYDVTFMGGTCFEFFDTCNEVSDFQFQTELEATAASQSLFAEVLINDFDTDPSLTFGCDTFACQIMTPFNVTLAGVVRSSTAQQIGASFNQIYVSSTDFDNISNPPGIGNPSVWAVWSPSVSPIPIPAAVWLFGTALIGLVGFSKCRKAASL